MKVPSNEDGGEVSSLFVLWCRQSFLLQEFGQTWAAEKPRPRPMEKWPSAAAGSSFLIVHVISLLSPFISINAHDRQYVYGHWSKIQVLWTTVPFPTRLFLVPFFDPQPKNGHSNPHNRRTYRHPEIFRIIHGALWLSQISVDTSLDTIDLNL